MFLTTKPADLPIRVCIATVILALSVVCANAQTKPLLPSSAPGPGETPKGTSVIRGRVIYSDTGRPLRRADVALINRDNESWNAHSVTNRSGEFVFANVSAGTYLVVVSALDIVRPVDQMESSSVSLALKIALGQIEDGFGAVTVESKTSVKTDIRVSRGGVITGRVLSEYDEPIAKAQIKLFQIKNGKAWPVNATRYVLDRDKRMFETDSRGIYRIAGLAAGEYIVRASESNEGGNPDDASEGSYTDGSMVVAYYPKALRIQDATGVIVQRGTESKDIDIRVPDRNVHRIAGTVVVRGHAASHVEIRLNRGEPDVSGHSFNSAQARTDSNGNWEIRAVPDGIYTLSISGSITGIVALGNEKGYVTVAPERREVIVAGADVTNLRTELFEGGELRGVVSVEGKRPLPDRLRLELVRSDPSSRIAAAVPLSAEKSFEVADVENDAGTPAFVRARGDFSFSELHSGLYQFRIYGLGTHFYVKAITLNGKDLLRNPVQIEQGKKLDGVRIVLSSDVVTLSGRVVDKSERNRPLPEAAILFFPVEAERRRMVEGPLIARADKKGGFVIKAAPDEYFVFVIDRRRKGISLLAPTEETLIKDAAKLQKLRIHGGTQKGIVEVVGH